MAKDTSSSGKPSTNMTRFFHAKPLRRVRKLLGFRFLRQHLAAAIHPGLEVDVVWTAQFAGILVLDIGWRLKRIGRSAHAAPRRRSLSFRHGHGVALLCLGSGRLECR